MTLQVLFDEKRRKEIRDGIRTGLLKFRKKPTPPVLLDGMRSPSDSAMRSNEKNGADASIYSVSIRVEIPPG
jgi:hypothetical protein